MSETSIAHREVAGLGPGRLVLVVGPSGAGKDTLLGIARAACASDSDIVFPRRIVTREPSEAEDNVAITPAEFHDALARGDFAAHWEAHGLFYALPADINVHIRDGRTVVVNVSRTVVAELRRSYAHVVVVAITAQPDVLAARLAARARQSDGKIAERLNRSIDEAGAQADVTIVNAGRAAYHGRQLVRVIRDECWRDELEVKG